MAGLDRAVTEELADSEHALAREATQLREALHVAVWKLREVTLQAARLRSDLARLRAAYRELRAARRDERPAA